MSSASSALRSDASDASNAAGQSAGGSQRCQATAPRFGSPRSALHASFGRPKRNLALLHSQRRFCPDRTRSTNVCSLFSVAPQAKHGAPSMFLTASPGLEDGVLCCFGFLLQGFCFRVVASGLLLRGHKTQRVFSVAPQAKHGSASTFLNGITAWRGIARPRGSRGRPPWRSRNPRSKNAKQKPKLAKQNPG